MFFENSKSVIAINTFVFMVLTIFADLFHIKVSVISKGEERNLPIRNDTIGQLSFVSMNNLILSIPALVKGRKEPFLMENKGMEMGEFLVTYFS